MKGHFLLFLVKLKRKWKEDEWSYRDQGKSQHKNEDTKYMQSSSKTNFWKINDNVLKAPRRAMIVRQQQ